MNQGVKDIINKCDNLHIVEAFLKADNVLHRPYRNIMVSLSGGADSDTVLDIISKVGAYGKVHYVFYDTGLEYQATKRHLDYLEKKYGIDIERVKPVKTIPQSVREFGVPFKSKILSETIGRCQRHGFGFEDEDYETLIEKYPNSIGLCKWWANQYNNLKNGMKSVYNIERYNGLKEMLIENPPDFRISAKCCYYAKKKPSKVYEKQKDIDLVCLGIRAAEGGARSVAYKNCFSDNSDNNKPDQFRPIFYFTDEDKRQYKEMFGLTYSDCYEVWGMKRTGCVGCPFDKDLEMDLRRIKQYEPQMYKACMNLFGKSYEYHREYKDRQEIKRKGFKQLSMIDLVEKISREAQ